MITLSQQLKISLELLGNVFQEHFSIGAMQLKDVFDILIIAFIIYRLFLLIRGTRAVQMLMGLAFVFIFYFISLWSDLKAVSWVLQNFWRISVIGVIILFQPEIRNALVRVGQQNFFRTYSNIEQSKLIDKLVRSVVALSEKRIGALIAMERNVNLQNYVEVGTKLDAIISKELILNIFFPNTPLHDGAIIIQNGKVSGAGAFLPLTLNQGLDQTIGTRHRAAIGLTEETDAIVIVVSEENAHISVAMNGKLEQNIDSVRLKTILRDVFDPASPNKKRGVAFFSKNKEAKLVKG